MFLNFRFLFVLLAISYFSSIECDIEFDKWTTFQEKLAANTDTASICVAPVETSRKCIKIVFEAFEKYGLFAIFDDSADGNFEKLAIDHIHTPIISEMVKYEKGKSTSAYLRSDGKLDIKRLMREKFAELNQCKNHMCIIADRNKLTVANFGNLTAVLCDQRGNAFNLTNDRMARDELDIFQLKLIDNHYFNNKPKFIILASDGLWNVMSSQEAVDFVGKRLDTKDYKAVELVQQALRLGSPIDTSVSILLLKNGKYKINAEDSDGWVKFGVIEATFTDTASLCRTRVDESAMFHRHIAYINDRSDQSIGFFALFEGKRKSLAHKHFYEPIKQKIIDGKSSFGSILAKSIANFSNNTKYLITIAEKRKLTVATDGDLGAVLCDEEGKAFNLTGEQTPRDKQGIFHVVLDVHKPRFMILASDGVWNVISSQDAVNFIGKRLDTKYYGADDLLQEALNRKSRGEISVLIVRFTNGKFKNRKQPEPVSAKQFQNGAELPTNGKSINCKHPVAFLAKHLENGLHTNGKLKNHKQPENGAILPTDGKPKNFKQLEIVPAKQLKNMASLFK